MPQKINIACTFSSDPKVNTPELSDISSHLHMYKTLAMLTKETPLKNEPLGYP